MTTPGGEWANARVGVTLNWDNVDAELKTRLVRSVEKATAEAQKHFDRLADRAAVAARRLADGYKNQLDRMRQHVRTTVIAINRDLDKLDRVLTVRLVLQAGSLLNDVRASLRDAQRFLDANPLRAAIEVANEAQFATQMAALLHDRTVSVGFDLDRGAIAAEITALLENLQRLFLDTNPLTVRLTLDEGTIAARLAELTRDRTTHINIETRGDGARAAADASKAFGGLGKVLGGLGSVLGSFGSSMLSVVGTVGKFAGIAGGLVIAAGAAVPVLAALASALASVGVAAGGAAAAGIAAAGLGIGTLMAGLSGVGGAFTEMGKAATAGGGAAADTTKQVEQAQRGLIVAVRDEKSAQKDLTRAREDARKVLRDLDLQLRGAQISEKEAALDLADAQDELAKGGFTNARERERAILRVQSAEQRVMETQRSNADLEADAADKRAKGVEGADEVVAAQQRLGDATYQVVQAQKALTEAQNPAAAAGGVDRVAEAMAKLSPNAQAFVKAVMAVRPAWDEMRKGVQDSLFAGLADRIQPLADTYLPMLGGAMSTVADGFNEGAKSALDFAQSGSGISVMSTLLEGSASMAAEFGSAIGNLVPGFAAVGAAATSVFSGLTGGIAEMAAGWSARMVEMQQNGELAAMFERAMVVVRQLGAVLGDIGGIISGVFNAAQAGGGNVLGTLGQALDSLNAFVNSTEGQTALTSFFQAVTSAVAAVLPILMQVIGIIGGQVAPMIAQVITTIAPVVSQLVAMIGQGFAALQPAIAPLSSAIAMIGAALAPLMPILGQLIATFVQFAGPILGQLALALSPIIGAIGEGLIAAFQALMPAIEPIVQLFDVLSPVIAQIAGILGEVLAGVITALVPVIVMLVDGFSQVMEAVQPLLPILGDALIQIITMVAPLIQQMAGFWLELVQALIPILPPLVQIVGALLPPLINLIMALMPILMLTAQLFIQLVTAIAPLLVMLANVIAKFAEVLGVIIDFGARVISTVSGFVSQVVTFFTGLVGTVISKAVELKDGVVAKLGELVEWVKGLPQKIGEAAAGMWNGISDAFKSMVNGLIDMWNGLSDKLTFKVPDIPGVPKRGETIRPIPKIAKLADGGAILARRLPSGLLRGPGGPRDDMIAGMIDGIPQVAVSNREMVMNADATAGWFPVLDAMNKGKPFDLMKLLPGLAGGGTVGREPYGLPAGSSGGGDLFPEWVHKLEQEFGVTASTYAGHQERDGQNKGIDWSGSVANMQRFAEFLASKAGDLEQVIWMNPETGQQIGVADGQMVGPGTDQPGYYRDDWAGHQDHVHTRQSYSIGSAPATDSPVEAPTASGAASMAGGGSTPIGSGIGASGPGGGSSWGNSGGGSKFNSAADAKTGGVTPVWVENWPAAIGSGSSSTIAAPDTGTGLTPDAGAPAGPMEVPTLTNDSSPEEVAKAIYAEAKNRGYSDEEAKAFISTGLQESGLQMVEGGGGAWHGYFQQDASYAERDDPNGNIRGFMDRMDEKRTADPNSDIWKRIFWLQQAPGMDSAEAAYNNGRQGYLTEIQSQQGRAAQLFDKAAAQGAMPVTIVDPSAPPPPTSGGDIPPAGTASDPVMVAPATTTTDPSALTTLSGPSSSAGFESMPFGVDRANAWASSQDWGSQFEGWAGGFGKEMLGQVLDPFGLKSVGDSAIDQLIAAIKEIQQPGGDVKFADSVTFVGAEPRQTEAATKQGMTSVLDTYRGGG